MRDSIERAGIHRLRSAHTLEVHRNAEGKGRGLKQRVRRMLARMHITDDFDSSRYTPEYREQGEETERVHTLVLEAGDYVFQRNRLQVRGTYCRCTQTVSCSTRQCYS